MKLSALGKTWLIDLDGTVLAHNAHLTGPERLLPGVRELWAKFGPEDHVIILTARDPQYEPATRAFFEEQGLRFDKMIFGLPTGERVLINDKKPFGLHTAIAVNVTRDGGLCGLGIKIDPAP
jgi:hypothetical protein